MSTNYAPFGEVSTDLENLFEAEDLEQERLEEDLFMCDLRQSLVGNVSVDEQ